MELESIKVVFGGPVGAGKSTAIRSVADAEPVSTEMPLVDGPMGEKTTTTVALDFATVMLDDGPPLFVYGLPGQEHFEFMYPIVVEGALGVVILLNGSAPDLVAQCERWLKTMRDINAAMPLVIGVTQTDALPSFSIKPLREVIKRCGAPVPVFTIDARSKEETTQLVRALLLEL